MARRRQSIAKRSLKQPKVEQVDLDTENEPVIESENQKTEKRRCDDTPENEPAKKIIKQEVEDEPENTDPEFNTQSRGESSATTSEQPMKSIIKKEVEEEDEVEESSELGDHDSDRFYSFTISSEELERGHFKPSHRDFTLPHYTYLKCILEQPEVMDLGIFKITPPKSWSPRGLTQRKGIDHLANEEVTPVTQIVSERRPGVFSRVIAQEPTMTLLEYFNEAMRNEIYYGEEPLDVYNMTENIFDKITERKPKYVIDHEGTLFDDAADGINLKTGVTEVFDGQTELPGITTPMMYYGMAASVFCVHKEDLDLHSINYLHYGSPKVWFSIRDGEVDHFEKVMQQAFPKEFRKCKDFIRHKTFMLSPEYLKKKGVNVDCVVQRPGDFVVTNPRGYHWGFNTGFNVAEAVNFGSKQWLYHGIRATKCTCPAQTNDVEMEWEKIFEVLKLPFDQQMIAHVYDQMTKRPFFLDLVGVGKVFELTRKNEGNETTLEEEEELNDLLDSAVGTPARRRQFVNNLRSALREMKKNSRIIKIE